MRIIGSIATIPSRINDLEPTLESLHNQSHKLDQLYVVVPKYCKKEQCGYTIPVFIKKYAQLVVIDEDYGPLNKLVGPLQKEDDPQTRVLTFDDDIVNPANLVAILSLQEETWTKARPPVSGIAR
jgi:hypothetical protein